MTNQEVIYTNEKALMRRVRNHVIGKSHRFFAVVHPGFEQIAYTELKTLQHGKITTCVSGGIEIDGKLIDLYGMSLGSGTASRFLMRLFSKEVLHLSQFQRHAQLFPWELYLKNGAELTFSVSIARSRLRYPKLLTEALGAAIQARLARFDRLVLLEGCRQKQPHANRQSVLIRLENNHVQVSLDASGELLYFRGYHRRTEEASIRETLARSILLSAGLEQYKILMDPMAGSGTFSLEAAMVHVKHPAGRKRSFAFESWPAFRPAAFAHLKKKLSASRDQSDTGLEKRIYCSDISEKAVETIRYNLDLTGYGNRVILERRDFFDIPAPGSKERTLLVMNPPYGLRMGTRKSVEQLYRNIGSKLRSDFNHCGIAILVPSLGLEKVLGLAYDKKCLFRNGGKQVALLIKHASGITPC